jgi:adenine-specific DNA-methyltransferase
MICLAERVKSTHEQINYEKLIVLGVEERVELVKKVCKSLMAYTIAYPKAEPLIENSDTPYSQNQAINNLEVHLTPPELADAITKYAVSFLDTKNPINFGDPSVGTGAFYAALLQNVERNRIQSAIGVDISPKQVQAAKWRWESKNMQVLQDDYLHMEKLPHRNLILANPPYMRHQGIPFTYKLELRQRASVTMGMKISGLSGQYVYFLLLSHQWMDEGAIAAWLIPSEFMQTSYGEAIREYLSHRVTLLRIHQFNHDDPQFENADVLPCVVVFKNIRPSKDSEAILSIGGTLENPAQVENVIISDLNPHMKWTIPLRSYEKYNKSDIRIKDLFNIKRGIATGANDFFILNKSQIESNELPDDVFTPILPKIRSISGDILEADDKGNPITEQQLFVLNVKLNQDEIERIPRLKDYISWGEQFRSRTLLKSRTPWYKQEIREPAPFLCTYMGRGDANTTPIRFIWNKSKAIATNNYLMLYPNSKLKELLEKDQNLYEELFNILKLAARNTLFEFTRIHAGGLNKIEPNELREVRLTNLPEKFRNAATTSLL